MSKHLPLSFPQPGLCLRTIHGQVLHVADVGPGKATAISILGGSQVPLSLSLYLYISIYIQIYIYIYLCLYLYVFIDRYISIDVYIYIYVFLYVIIFLQHYKSLLYLYKPPCPIPSDAPSPQAIFRNLPQATGPGTYFI